jgi:SPP1 family predicted phage head-tail adaptor
MAKQRSAGDLFNKVAFDERVEGDRGDGVTVGEWQERFSVRAGFTHMRGGEAVMANRLQGKHTIVIMVRSSSQTRQVGTDWQVRDVRSGVAYNITDITPSDDRAWLDLLCESGVATG